ncbi:MAG TPA: hypothetical protein VGG74_24395 [Kofleriaceae bacterium]|jgi:hypothetical protein
MRRLALVVFVLAAGCSKKQSTGLAPAKDWGAQQQSMAGDNPHAGMGNNPSARDPNNPHAGLGLNAEGEPEDDEGVANPHAGMGGGVDVSKLGLPPPDPNRAIDPSRFVKGVITVDSKAADRMKPGSVVFVVVKRADASGQPTGTALAVDKLTWQKDQLPFELGEEQAMVGGTELVGDVIVEAHFAQNGDALSKDAGDITGQTRVKIPAEHVKVVLDKVL